MDARHLIDVSKHLTHAMQDIIVDKYGLDQKESAYVLAMSIHVFTQLAKNRVAFQDYLDQLNIPVVKQNNNGIQH